MSLAASVFQRTWGFESLSETVFEVSLATTEVIPPERKQWRP